MGGATVEFHKDLVKRIYITCTPKQNKNKKTLSSAVTACVVLCSFHHFLQQVM